MLEMSHVCAGYHGASVLNDMNISIKSGSVTGVFASHGSGKTTLVNVFMGIVAPISGSVKVDDKDITDMPTDLRVQHGIICTPENRGLFKSMTVLDHLKLGFSVNTHEHADFKERLDFCHTLFPILSKRPNQIVGTLSGGEQQMIAIAKSLMASPAYLILDEPMLGLSPVVVDMVLKTLEHLKTSGLGILITDQSHYNRILNVDTVVRL